MKKILFIGLLISALFAQSGNDRQGTFISGWYDTILGLKDTTITGVVDTFQYVQDQRGNLTDMRVYSDGTVVIDNINLSTQNSLAGAYYNFDGNNDKIPFSDLATTGYSKDGACNLRFRTGTDISTIQYIIGGFSPRFYLRIDSGSLYLTLGDNILNEISDNLQSNIVYSLGFTWSVDNSGDGTIEAWLQGIKVGGTFSPTGFTSFPANLSLGVNVSSDWFKGNIYNCQFFNYVPSDVRMAEMSKWDSKNPPVWNDAVGGSPDEFAIDGDMSVPGSWNIQAQWAIAGGQATATGNSTNSWLWQIANETVEIGKQVAITYTVVSNSLTGQNTLQVGARSVTVDIFTNVILDNSNTVGTHTQYFIVPDTDPTTPKTQIAIRLSSGSTGGTVVIDDVSVVAIGCIANYNEVGMTNGYWNDNSGNKFNETVSGATLNGQTEIPSFSVYGGNTGQSGIVTSTYTKLTNWTEDWDTHSDFASNTYTPSVTMKYIMIGGIWLASGDISADEQLSLVLYKNGSRIKQNTIRYEGTGNFEGPSISVLVDANGTTDYFDLYVWHSVGVNKSIVGVGEVSPVSAYVYWQGHGIP